MSHGQKVVFFEWLSVEMSKRGWSQSDLARSAELNRLRPSIVQPVCFLRIPIMMIVWTN